MNEIKISVKNNSAVALNQVNLIAGTVGQKVLFFFDKEWRDLQKHISYKVGTTVLRTDLLLDTTTIIPPEVMRTAAGLPLEIGITGYSADRSTIVPTSWCYVGRIQNGANSANYGGNTAPDYNPGLHVIYDGGVIQ